MSYVFDTSQLCCGVVHFFDVRKHFDFTIQEFRDSGIGLFVTVPLSLIAHASVYRTLAGQQKPQTKPKITRLFDRPFDPNVDIYTLTEEEFIRRLQKFLVR